eukprot:TRINITY_DN11150_c1_g1_i1.p1 TRINITY_DN11150_c1_g1~~TRINITY_DN11150_c1_g1_i1.p1  ORF type:complete len:394 (+),score=87.78 TRINITY_DN11150_c1_g1_i1:65-1183(+)
MRECDGDAGCRPVHQVHSQRRRSRNFPARQVRRRSWAQASLVSAAAACLVGCALVSALGLAGRLRGAAWVAGGFWRAAAQLPRSSSSGPGWRSPAAGRRQLTVALAAAASEDGFLDELILKAGLVPEDALVDAVDEGFPKIKPEDLTALQARLAASEESGDQTVQSNVVTLSKAIQVCMDKRMAQAAKDIDVLLQSSGDIDANIRECFAQQDSPLPIMAVLQMNIAKAKDSGEETQLLALEYVFKIVSAELEEKLVPPAKRVLGRLLTSSDTDARRKLLRGVLAPAQGEKLEPEELSKALVTMVADTEKQFVASGGGDGSSPNAQSRAGSLELIRTAAIDAGVVVGQVCGAERQNDFTVSLRPLFEALTRTL